MFLVYYGSEVWLAIENALNSVMVVERELCPVSHLKLGLRACFDQVFLSPVMPLCPLPMLLLQMFQSYRVFILDNTGWRNCWQLEA